MTRKRKHDDESEAAEETPAFTPEPETQPEPSEKAEEPYPGYQPYPKWVTGPWGKKIVQSKAEHDALLAGENKPE